MALAPFYSVTVRPWQPTGISFNASYIRQTRPGNSARTVCSFLWWGCLSGGKCDII